MVRVIAQPAVGAAPSPRRGVFQRGQWVAQAGAVSRRDVHRRALWPPASRRGRRSHRPRPRRLRYGADHLWPSLGKGALVLEVAQRKPFHVREGVAQVLRRPLDHMGAPALPPRSGQDVAAYLPVESHQPPVHRQRRPLLGVVDARLRLGQPGGLVGGERGEVRQGQGPPRRSGRTAGGEAGGRGCGEGCPFCSPARRFPPRLVRRTSRNGSSSPWAVRRIGSR